MAQPAITSRSEDFAAWYQDVVLGGDMAEPAEIVKGCMVIKPKGYAVWELLQRALDDRFKATRLGMADQLGCQHAPDWRIGHEPLR